MLRRFIVVMVIIGVHVACTQPAAPMVTQPPAEPTITLPSTQTPTLIPSPMPTPSPKPTHTPIPDPYAEVDPSGQTVMFWHNHLFERREALRSIISTFNRTNPYGVTVEEEFRGGTDDLFARYLNADPPPNLIVSYQNQAARYYEQGYIIDLTDLLNSPTWGITEEDYVSAFLAGDRFPQYGGAQLGFAVNRSMEVMYYNADWLDRLRAEGAVEGVPQTPQAFQQAACAAAESPFHEGTNATGYAISPGASTLASWVFAFGGEIYEEGRYTYDSPAAIAAMNFLQELIEARCGQIVTARYADQTAFGTGTALFTVGTSSGIPFYEQAVANRAPFTWSVAALPHTTPEPVQNLYGPSISISDAGLEAVLASWLFLQFYSQPTPQADWAQASGYFPVNRAAAEQMQPFMVQNTPYAEAYQLLAYGTSEPTDAGYDRVRILAEDAMRDILNGADPATTLQDLTQAANAEE